MWDEFTRTPGKVYGGATGDVACDHYHRYKEDIKMMKELGVTHYRYSISWVRVMPDGTGTVNQKGLQWYKDLTGQSVSDGSSSSSKQAGRDTTQA